MEFPSGSGAKANTLLGFLARTVTSNGYLPNIRVVFTLLPSAPKPLVARWENAIPFPSPDTNAVCRVPRKPRCKMDTPSECPSTFRVSKTVRAWGDIDKKGFAGFASSHVKM